MILEIRNKSRITALIIFFLFSLISQKTLAQNSCLTTAEAEKAIGSLNSTNKTADKQLRLELLNLQQTYQKIEKQIIDNPKENQKLVAGLYDKGDKNLLRVCAIIKEDGWLTEDLVEKDGVAAALFIIKNSKSVGLQKEIFPVVAAAVKKGLVGSDQLAALVDIIRVGSGLTQIFGTQIYIKDDVFYLNPLQNESRVDEWRNLYSLPPLANFIKYIQFQYQTVVLKSSRPPVTDQNKEKTTAAATVEPFTDAEKEDIIKVESSLVNINVRVNSGNSGTAIPVLQKNDIAVFEEGKRQEITYFSTAETPFDIILLLDLSGSTTDKQDLIRKSTRKFIESARPTDRIAIVTFTDEIKIVSNLTDNHEELLNSIKNIKGFGGSAVWGSLQFVYDKIIKNQSQNRRTAVVMMTDGVDSSLINTTLMSASYPVFADVLETVRIGDTTIFPIFLDTSAQDFERKAYRTAQKTLEILADDSGGQLYFAKKVNDLNGIYEKIINELGKIYSLSYELSADAPRGSFRTLSVTLPNHPELTVRTKRGYYVK